MFLKTRRAAFTAVIAALAVGAPAASAGAASAPATYPAGTDLSCPDSYAGPTNLATGCPYWAMVPDRFAHCPAPSRADLPVHAMTAVSRQGGPDGCGVRGMVQ